MSKPILTQSHLKSLFDYDQKTGAFTRIASLRKDRIGQQAGHINKRGYVTVSVHNQLYYAHRLAWMYVYGVWPAKLIDHIDTDKTNNRIANLRVTDDRGNKENRKTPYANTASGVLGVYRTSKRWYSKIKVGGRQIYLGVHDSAALAHEAYVLAKRMYHPTCTL